MLELLWPKSLWRRKTITHIKLEFIKRIDVQKIVNVSFQRNKNRLCIIGNTLTRSITRFQLVFCKSDFEKALLYFWFSRWLMNGLANFNKFHCWHWKSFIIWQQIKYFTEKKIATRLLSRLRASGLPYIRADVLISCIFNEKNNC